MGDTQTPVESTSLESSMAAVEINSEAAPSATTAATSVADTTSSSSPVASRLRALKDTPLKTPIVDALETTTIPAAKELTPDQQAKYDELLKTVKSWEKIPSTTGKEGPITDREIMWLTRECLLRYLRATKWSLTEAEKRLLGTLTWRRDYGVEELTADYISPENETGKQMILGYDINGRPCQYLNPGKQNTEVSPRQVQHLVFMVERVIEMMIPGQETLALLINFKAGKTRTNTSPGIGQGREVLNILQTHYPERLGRALIINVPWVVSGFFKLITPFIDPLTREKLKFNDNMRHLVTPTQLWNEFQGDLEFEYDHATYWPALMELCEERRNEQIARWEKAGKKYGESETYIKGGDVPSVATSAVESSEPPNPKKRMMEEPVESAETSAAAEVTEPQVSEQTSGTQTTGNKDIAAVADESKPTVA